MMGGPARAQSFGPPVPTDLVLMLLDAEGNIRFTLAAYAAVWENPFRPTVSTVSPALGQVVSREVNLVSRSSTSPLIEGSYAIDKHWTVGFWYNPIEADSDPVFVQIADVPKIVDLSAKADLMDFHVVYYGSRGLSTQLGYYYESGKVRVRASDPVPNPTPREQSGRYRLGSWNGWVTQRLDIRAGRLLITPYLSAGYHTSSSMGHPASILAGAGITFNERLSLSGSVWWLDLEDPATRLTAGLVYRF